MTDEPASTFKAENADTPGAAGLALVGEIDVAAVPALERALEAAIEASEGGFVVDLAGVEFMDSSGLLAMLNARGLLAEAQRGFAAVIPAGPVRHLVEVAGVAELLAVCDSREEAEATVA
jgi:stage II sporulation protein AA (anti-sigma F factor antagonist)